MAKIFKEAQLKAAKEANSAICKLRDMDCSTQYVGERNYLTDDEKEILLKANAICIRISRECVPS